MRKALTLKNQINPRAFKKRHSRNGEPLNLLMHVDEFFIEHDKVGVGNGDKMVMFASRVCPSVFAYKSFGVTEHVQLSPIDNSFETIVD